MKRTGWFNESARHSLAAKGVKTGKLLSRAINPYGEALRQSLEGKTLYYKVSAVSDKDKVSSIAEEIERRLKAAGYDVIVSVKDGITLHQIRISQSRIDSQGHNWQEKFYGEGESTHKRTRALAWDDWVAVNDIVNDVLDDAGVSANVKSLGGKFDIRDKTEGRRTRSDWEHLYDDNVGSMIRPIGRGDYILQPGEALEAGVLTKKQERELRKKEAFKQGTKFGVLDETGNVSKSMTIDLSKVKSDDPLAYSYGFFQGKSGQPMVKDKNLVPEYIRGFKEGQKAARK